MAGLVLRRYVLSGAALLVLLCGCGGSRSAGIPGALPSTAQSATLRLPQWQTTHAAHAACEAAHVGEAQCLVLIADTGIGRACAGSKCGWTPADFQARYRLPSTKKGSGQIVAIVDAGDNPDAATDLAQYRGEFGLGKAKFHKYNQRGQEKDYPSYTGWSVEIDLDVEMVSAVCPLCTVDLVEANSADGNDLDAAEARAVKLGAHIVSNSWICYGSVNCVGLTYFDKPGVTYLGASGDAGFDHIGAPAALDSVAAIGGTQLSKSGSHYKETPWDDSGGGCETAVPRPPWQHDRMCPGRAVSDASAEAGCSPGVAEYDSYDGGWFGVCGTSVATPLLAGVFGLAGNATRQEGGRTFWKAAHHRDLYTVCSPCLFSTYAFSTGWGSPNGIGAF